MCESKEQSVVHKKHLPRKKTMTGKRLIFIQAGKGHEEFISVGSKVSINGDDVVLWLLVPGWDESNNEETPPPPKNVLELRPRVKQIMTSAFRNSTRRRCNG